MEKPFGGLWTSPINSKYGWKDCGIRDCFDKDSFLLKFKPGAKIIIIDSLDDLKKIPTQIDLYSSFFYSIDFELLAENYDAIWLTAEGQWKTRLSIPNLYGWDCECVLILNKESVEQI